MKRRDNDFVSDGGVSYLYLRNKLDEVVGEVILDTEDLEKVLNKGAWYITQKGYATCDGRNFSGRGKTSMHRFILNAPKDAQVDHSNGNRLDNRKANLQIVNGFLNQQNRAGANKNNRSGYRNVHWHKQSGRWAVIIVHNGKTHSCGLWDTPEEANEVAIEKRKEFGVYNGQDKIPAQRANAEVLPKGELRI
jgi:hypothetical protein